MSFKLPIIDMSKAKTHREELAHEVAVALKNIGFLFIDNIEEIDFEKLRRCCKWFFGQSYDVKNEILRNCWNSKNSNVYRGYFPVKELEPSRKEGFEFGKDPPENSEASMDNWLKEKSVWPREDGKFPFKDFLQDLYNSYHEISMEILRLASLGLGIPENSFEYMFDDHPLSTFRLIHYPPWDGKPPSNARIEDDKVVVTPEHTDSNFLTLLTTFDFKGLEVLSADKKWEVVEPRPSGLVMNIGDTLSQMVGGRFKATLHRVIDIGIDRYSVPFFLEPSFDTDIGVDVVKRAQGQDKDHECVKYGPWLVKQMKHVKNYFEFRNLPDLV